MRKRIDFLGMRKMWFTISAILILIGFVSMAIPGHGFKLGIDFTGGLLTDVKFEKPVTTSGVREALAASGVEGAQIQIASEDNTQVILRTRSLTQDESKAMNQALEKQLGKFEVLRVEEVKGVIGSELARKGLFALVIANIGMVIYITLRFEYKFALTGIAALIHDVLIVIGFYSILGYEANSPFVAAILTIVGYSINDTIVVFDRIRENQKIMRREPLSEVVNVSINQTMTRSLNTSLTTLLALLAVFLFGGRTIRDFTVALMIGITAGTYSSIFIASPLWYLWKMREELQSARPIAEVAVAGAASRAAAMSRTAAAPGAPEPTAAKVQVPKKTGARAGARKGKPKKRR